VQKVVNHDRFKDVQLEIPLASSKRDRGVIAGDLDGDHGHGRKDDRCSVAQQNPRLTPAANAAPTGHSNKGHSTSVNSDGTTGLLRNTSLWREAKSRAQLRHMASANGITSGSSSP
jgi:hypothetical protein